MNEREQTRIRIQTLHGLNWSDHRISSYLNVPRSTVRRWRNRTTHFDNFRSGHPREISERTRRLLVRRMHWTTARDRHTLRRVSSEFGARSLRMTRSSASRILREEGLIARHQIRVPALSAANKAKRVEFANRFRHQNWRKVCFISSTFFSFLMTPT